MSGKPLSILLGTDFSESSDRALACALDLAVRMSARLDLAHVCDLPEAVDPTHLAPAPDDTPYAAEIKKQLRERRKMLEALAERVGVEWGWCGLHLLLGEPAPALLRLINQVRPSLVVVGSHGRRGLKRVLLGSVSDTLCQTSPVPVLVVPSPWRAASHSTEDQDGPRAHA